MQTGDIVLVHANHFCSKLIRFGQRLRFRGKRRPYAYWNHVALVLSSNGTIAEALSNGVVKTHISKYPADSIAYVETNASLEDQDQILDFANSVLSARWRYGYSTIIALAITLLTGSKFVFGKVGTAICSGFACEALTRKGEVFPRPPAYMMPADVAEHFQVRVGQGTKGSDCRRVVQPTAN